MVVAVKPRCGKDRTIAPVDQAAGAATVVKVSRIIAVGGEPLAGKDRKITPIDHASVIHISLQTVAHRPDLSVNFPGQVPTWEPFNNGLPNSAVLDLAINGNTGTLVAATFGRSMFRVVCAIYVDASWSGHEDGTVQFPFNTFSEGVSSVPVHGQLWVRAGNYTGTGNVPIAIDKAMTE